MGFLQKIFGGGKSGSYKDGMNLVETVLRGTLDRANLDISFDLKESEENGKLLLEVDFYRQDEKLFTGKDGALLDAFQKILKRAIQNHFPEDNILVNCDCNNFRENANQGLIELAERLKQRAIDQGKSVYLRALAPKDRKVIHQFLASDERVKSRSIGDGLYKKIKIYPVKNEGDNSSAT